MSIIVFIFGTIFGFSFAVLGEYFKEKRAIEEKRILLLGDSYEIKKTEGKNI